MRPAAALVYLASVARVAAIEYGYPSRQVYVELHRRQPRLSWRRHPDTQFKKKFKLANLTSDLPTPVASTSAPLSTCSASVTVVNSTSNDMLNSFVFDSFVLPQNNIELAVELAQTAPQRHPRRVRHLGLGLGKGEVEGKGKG